MSNGLVTRANIDKALDDRNIEVAMRNGNWWAVRRNGQTKTWKRDPRRIAIPVKSGLKSCTTITETDFITVDGVEVLNPEYYRLREGSK